jgi:hypothetical protein
MDFQSLVTLLKKLVKNNMNDIKDTAATVTTIAGGGMAVMGINEILTLALLVTGIALNIIRIRAINKDKKEK